MACPATYRWQPLTKSTSFRLLKLLPGQPADELRCKIIVADLSRRPTYSAISYVWGSEEDKADVRCGDYVLMVTRNLEAALRQFRHPVTTRILWTDIMCIDQSNISERNQQVRLMGQIYENATEVLIWAWDDQYDFNTQALVKSINSFWENQNHETLRAKFNLPALDSEELAALTALWHIPYFQRAWTFQECFLSRNWQFYFGPFQISANVLAQVWFGYGLVSQAVNDADVMKNASPKALPYMTGTKRELIERGESALKWTTLWALLQRRCGVKCKDPRDIVYALLGSITDDVQFEPDYGKPVHLVFAEAVIHIIRVHGELGVLREIQPLINLSDLPSWVPDWRQPWLDSKWTLSCVYAQPDVPFRCTGLTKPACTLSADGLRLTVRGHAYDTVKATHHSTQYNLAHVFQDLSQGSAISEQISIDGHAQPVNISILRTQCAGLDLPNARTDQQWNRSSVEKYVHVLRARGDNASDYQRIQNDIAKQAKGHLLMGTEDGSLGLAPGQTLPDDVIALMPGSRVPILLRQTGAAFHLIGECYVDGIMNGEAFERCSPAPSRDFVLV